VAKGKVDAYNTANVCVNPPTACPLACILDQRVAECNTGTQKCEMVAPGSIRCGGFTTNPHSCPSGYQCKYNNVPDVPGTCVQTDACGGCPSGQWCSACWGK